MCEWCRQQANALGEQQAILRRRMAAMGRHEIMVKEMTMKATLNIGPAPAIVQTAGRLDPGIVFVSKNGVTHLRVQFGVVPLEGMNAWAKIEGNYKDIEVSRVVGPLEITR